MNKQNKKIAQEKRRIEREKAEKKAKVVNLLKFWVPVVAINGKTAMAMKS